MISTNQMLHAAQLSFEIGGSGMRLVAPAPTEWGKLGFNHPSD
jgi:hypothetical protein